MQMTLETLGQLERRLHVAVPIEQIEGEIQKRLARLAKTVKIAGFRPGKVPLKMVTQQYGPQVRSDVISDTVQSEPQRCDPRAEPARGGLSAHRAQAARRPRISSNFPPCSRFIRRSRSAICPASRSCGRLPKSPPPMSSTRSISCASKTCATRSCNAAARDEDRVMVDFSGKIDGVEFPGGQAKDFAITSARVACCRSSTLRSPAWPRARQGRSSSSSRRTTTAAKSPARPRSSR